MVSGRGLISIWFFVGAILLAYGALILGAGIYELGHPPQSRVVLANLHANIWWGALLLAMGTFYVWRFAPWRSK